MEKANNYWLHRVTGGENARGVSLNLLKDGFISIGWSDFSNEKSLEKIRADEQTFNQMFIDEWGELPGHRWNLRRFANDMQQGDIVVIPAPYTFSVYRISDDQIYTVESIDKNLLKDWNEEIISLKQDGYLYNSNNLHVDLGFFRKVELLEKDIPRDGFADQSLYSRLKIPKTNTCINDIKNSVIEALKNYRENKPINLRKSILDEASVIVLEKIHKLQNDSKFEDLVKWYFKSLGAKVKTPSKNESPSEEGDADIVAYFDKLGIAIMVQAKKHTGETDNWAVQQIKEYKKNHNFEDYTSILWVISTCDNFSEEAIQEAATNEIKLINGKEFARMILDAGLGGLNF